MLKEYYESPVTPNPFSILENVLDTIVPARHGAFWLQRQDCMHAQHKAAAILPQHLHATTPPQFERWSSTEERSSVDGSGTTRKGSKRAGRPRMPTDWVS